MTTPVIRIKGSSDADDSIVRSGWSIPPWLGWLLLCLMIVITVLYAMVRRANEHSANIPPLELPEMVYKGHIRVIVDMPGNLILDDVRTSIPPDSILTVSNGDHTLVYEPVDSTYRRRKKTVFVDNEPRDEPVDVDLRSKVSSTPTRSGPKR